MSHISVVSISSIMAYFTEARIIKKAENAINSNHVCKMQFDDDLGCIRGQVQASMKNRFYTVEIILKGSEIESCTCNCPRGLAVCHHMASLALFAHYNISVTDKQCNWLKKKGVDVVTAEKCFPSTGSPSYSPLAEPIDDEAVTELFRELSLSGPTHMQWIMAPEPIGSESIVPDVEKLIFSTDYNTAINKSSYLLGHLEISVDKVKEVARLTAGQSSNPTWLIVRKHRLTASNFGRIIKATKLSKYPPSLYKMLTGSYNLDGIKQIQYGRNTEGTAIKKFEDLHHVKVEKTGIHLHTCGYLGASPDGLVGSNCIVEVKCPYKYRDELFVNVLKKDTKYVVSFSELSNMFIINKDHEYYHQIQGQLHIMNKQKCYLVLYSHIDLLVVEIPKEIEWGSNIQILQNFYVNNYIPHILS